MQIQVQECVDPHLHSLTLSGNGAWAQGLYFYLPNKIYTVK